MESVTAACDAFGARVIPTELGMDSTAPLRNHGTHLLRPLVTVDPEQS